MSQSAASVDGDVQTVCRNFIGRTRSSVDLLSPRASNQLFATLDDASVVVVGDPLPPLFHWLHFDTPVRTDALRDDGHEAPGCFLPPVPLPRRMWAGSDLVFHRPLVLGVDATRHSRIADVTFKNGRHGPLCFVVVEHVHEQRGQPCLTDRHTIVYRGVSTDQLTLKAPSPDFADGGGSAAARSLSATQLFRYSALTFNTHRIHLDRDYARNVEGYPGLVVHGPLMATLLMRQALLQSPERTPVRFAFRAHAPLFDGESFRLEHDSVAESTEGDRAPTRRDRAPEIGTDLRLRACDGSICVSARVTWEHSLSTGG